MSTMRTINLTILHWAAIAVAAIGALNWGLVGIGYFIDSNLNVVNQIFGSMAGVENGIYLLVGLAGVFLVVWAIRLSRSGMVEPTASMERSEPAK